MRSTAAIAESRLRFQKVSASAPTATILANFCRVENVFTANIAGISLLKLVKLRVRSATGVLCSPEKIRRPMSYLRFSLLFFYPCACLVILTGACESKPSPAESKPTPPPAEAKAPAHEEIVDVSPKRMMDDYAANSARAEALYSGKRIRIHGPVQKIGPQQVLLNSGAASGEGYDGDTHCLGLPREQMAALNKGDQVTLVGTATFRSDGSRGVDLDLNHCSLER
jgi:hypothetical protein